MSENITITFTDQSEEITITLNENARGPAGSDATVTTAAVRAAVPNIVEVSSPANDDFIQRVGGSWLTRTIAQVRTALGLGSAAYTASTDYATAAQGTTADGALQRSGGTMTGNLAMGGSDITGALNVSARTVDLGTSSSQDGSLVLRNASNNNIYAINAASISGTWTGTMPDKSGTFAMTDDAAMTNERVPTAAGLAAKITGATSKATPVDADEIPLADSAASFGLKKLTWANLKATLKTYFDGLYVALTGNQTITGNKTFSGQTELTGQAATNSTSAMTRGLSDLRYLASPDIVIHGGMLDNDFATRMWNAGATTGSGATSTSAFQILAQTGSTTGSKAYIRISSNYPLWFSRDGVNGLGINYDGNWIFSLRADITNAANNTDGYIVFGLDSGNTSTAQPSTKSFGLRVHNGGVHAFVHDGSTYTESTSFLSVAGAVNIVRKFTFLRTGSSILYYYNDSLVATLTSPTGTSGNGTATIGFWVDNETTTEDFQIRIQGSIKFTNIQ